MNNNIICSGSIVGSHMGIVKLLDRMLHNMNQVEPSCLSQPMTDQMILNIIIYEQLLTHNGEPTSLDIFIPDNYYSPMLTMGYIPPEYFRVSHQSDTVTQFSDLGIASISISEELGDKSYTKNNLQTRRPAAYVHQYDRFMDIMKEINFGLGCGRGQYYGDKGEFMLSAAYPKKRKRTS